MAIKKSDNDLLYAFRHGARLVKRYGVIHVLREALFISAISFRTPAAVCNGIGTGQLVDRD